MSSLLLYSRLFDLALWALVAVCLLPAFLRSLTKGPHWHCDQYRVALFFVALLIAGNYGVRLQEQASLPALLGLNAIAAALALYLLVLVRQSRVLRRRDPHDHGS